ncbi:MAG: HlyD family efflux transporter periplasmic adaptor subunit [Bacteroidota bacterium]
MYKITILFATLLLFAACEEEVALSDAYGNFEATATTVSSEATGQLLFLNVEEGRKISADDLIALVDTTQLHLQRKQIEATINTLPKKLRNSIADIEVLKNQKANLIRERDRVQRLVAKKAATTKQLDDLVGQIEVVDKQVKALESTTQINNRSVLAEKGPLMAQIAIVNEQIRNCYIYNPIDGTVLTKLTEPYEMVSMGTPLYRIGQLDTMTLRFYTDAVQLQRISLGTVVQVLIDDGAEGYQELEGTVSWIAEQAEFTPKTIQTKEDRVNLVYAVKAKVPNPDGLLKIGMPAEVNLEKRVLQAQPDTETAKIQ